MADETKLADDANAKQAQALLDALAPKLAETLLPQLTAHVEDQIKGIKDNSERLLSRLHKEREGKTSLEDQLATLTKQLSGDARPKEVVIDKQTARDPRAYRAAKAEAEKAGVPLRIDREMS